VYADEHQPLRPAEPAMRRYLLIAALVVFGCAYSVLLLYATP
jgi:hypothetical protein